MKKSVYMAALTLGIGVAGLTGISLTETAAPAAHAEYCDANGVDVLQPGDDPAAGGYACGDYYQTPVAAPSTGTVPGGEDYYGGYYGGLPSLGNLSLPGLGGHGFGHHGHGGGGGGHH